MLIENFFEYPFPAVPRAAKSRPVLAPVLGAVVRRGQQLHGLGEAGALGFGGGGELGGGGGQRAQASSRAQTTVPFRPRVATTPAASSSL